MTIERVFIAGAGLMGSGIAQVCAQAGIRVTLNDVSEQALNKGMKSIAWSVGKLAFARRMGPFETGDMVGLDVSFGALTAIYRESRDMRYPPSCCGEWSKPGISGARPAKAGMFTMRMVAKRRKMDERNCNYRRGKNPGGTVYGRLESNPRL